MLEDIRKVTFSGVEHLDDERLFKSPVEGEFPIGAYLMHLAECEIFWLEVLSAVEQPEDLKKASYYDSWFDVPKANSSPPLSPLPKKNYFEVLDKARKNLFDCLDTMEDKDLEENATFSAGENERSFPKKWIIYHLIEHEAHHRGQMFMLIRKAGWNKQHS